MSAATITVEKLSPALGAAIRGVDLARPVDDASFARILEAWHGHCVLVFPDQQLDGPAQLRFAGRFGELGSHRGPGSENDRDPRTMWIGNVQQPGEAESRASDGEFYFHSDMAYYREPHKATFLYAITVPSVGGHTRFANLYRACELLPDELRRRLEGRRALHIYDYTLTKPLSLDGIELDSYHHYWHPLFTRHPATGREVLFFSRLMTRRIEGLSDAENAEVIEQLIACTERPDIIYEHPWRVGDLAIWDNRCVNHGRTDFPATEKRLLRRCTAIGTTPVAA